MLPRSARAPLGAVLLACGLVAAACGADHPDVEVRSPAPRGAADRATLPGTVQALNEFGLDVFRSEATRSAGNVALAPVELARSLAMARVGAAGRTRTELEAVLHADRSPDLDRGFTAVDDLLTSRVGDRRTATRKGSVAVDRGATVWAPQGTTFRQEFLAVLARDYGTGARTVDFRADPDASRRTINRWGSSVTRGDVSELVPRGTVSEYTSMLLASTFTLRASWHQPFQHVATAPRPFHLADGHTVEVPMMATEGARTVDHAVGPGWTAVELPYLSDELAMLVVVPDAGTIAAFTASLDLPLLEQVRRSLEPTAADVRLPRFQFTTQLRLDDTLRSLGLVQGQTETLAEFNGITSDEPLVVSAVIQQSYAAASEDGSGGVPGAIAVQEPGGAPGAPAATVTVDRPFVFAVVDRSSGLVLSIGQVQNPLG